MTLQSDLTELIDTITKFYTGGTDEKDHSRLHNTLMTYMNSPDALQFGQALIQHEAHNVVFWGGTAISQYTQKYPQNISSENSVALQNQVTTIMLSKKLPEYVVTKLCTVLVRLCLINFQQQPNPIQDFYSRLSTSPVLFLQLLTIFIEEFDHFLTLELLPASARPIATSALDHVISFIISFLKTSSHVAPSLICLEAWINSIHITLSALPNDLLPSLSLHVSSSHFVIVLGVVSALLQHPLNLAQAKNSLVEFLAALAEYIGKVGGEYGDDYRFANFLVNSLEFLIDESKDVSIILKYLQFLIHPLSSYEYNCFEAACHSLENLTNIQKFDKNSLQPIVGCLKTIVNFLIFRVSEVARLEDSSFLAFCLSRSKDAVESLFYLIGEDVFSVLFEILSTELAKQNLKNEELFIIGTCLTFLSKLSDQLGKNEQKCLFIFNLFKVAMHYLDPEVACPLFFKSSCLSFFLNYRHFMGEFNEQSPAEFFKIYQSYYRLRFQPKRRRISTFHF
ncbi:hypothetical protein GEMRC1_007148 [Eukaryota sp. GEM-RC1]